MWQVVQNETCGKYYKVWQLLQNETSHLRAAGCYKVLHKFPECFRSLWTSLSLKIHSQWRKKVAENYCFLTLYWEKNNGKISVLVCRKPKHKFTMEEENSGELLFLDTLGFLHWYVGNLNILSNTYTTALITKQVVRKMLLLFPPYLIEHFPVSSIKLTSPMKILELRKYYQ